MDSPPIRIDAQQQHLFTSFPDLSIHCRQEDEKKKDVVCWSEGIQNQNNQKLGEEDELICAICLNKIAALEDTALVKGCEHAYCVICILQWATCKKEPTCPQCTRPFEYLYISRSLDGTVHDYLFEESVCLLLRAPWILSFNLVEDDFYPYEYEEEEEDEDEVYIRRWKQEVAQQPRFRDSADHAGPSSREPKKKESAAARDMVAAMDDRRAKRALKREAADKAAAAKHLRHLVRLGRKPSSVRCSSSL
ncbi:uncharacterized protein [Rutidosis leptorrhynchoides]|uniref:uncharacterized protein n=1 Tax=Rutidosis leptorrhynchoides TaxID=125765 RepID=UPI003A99A09D